MSDCMIIRRGGGGQGFDPNGAALKVVTSTGCTVAVTNATAGYSKTHQQADGYPRSNDADVTEHFFSIPASAFGDLTVTVSKVYTNEGVSDTLTASKTIAVNTAGKVYELLIAAPNIILDSTFGLQDGYADQIVYRYAEYNERYKRIDISNRPNPSTVLFDYDLIPVKAYSEVKISAVGWETSYGGSISIFDEDNTDISSLVNFSAYGSTITGTISNVHYDTAGIKIGVIRTITEIVFT